MRRVSRENKKIRLFSFPKLFKQKGKGWESVSYDNGDYRLRCFRIVRDVTEERPEIGVYSTFHVEKKL